MNLKMKAKYIPSEGYRIAFLATGLSHGGAETQLKHLAIELKKHGWEIMVVSMMPPMAYSAELAESGIEVVSLHMRRGKPSPRALLDVASILRLWRPHVVHSFMVHANFLARLSRLLYRAPVQISSARNTHEGGGLRMLAYRLTDPMCDLTTQVSSAGAERYIEIGAVPQAKMRMVPNGIETACFLPRPELGQRMRAELNTGDAFVWLTVGRLEEQKNYPNLMRAFSKIVTEWPNTLLLVVGNGSLEEEIKVLVSSLGLQGHVRFIGTRHDMPAIMNAADAFVMASSWEGMSNALLEASATGLPVVATDVGGSREVIADKQTGLLVPPHNAESLARAMDDIMSASPTERKRMGQAGRAFIDENFSLHSIASIWERLYSELLEQKRGLII